MIDRDAYERARYAHEDEQIGRMKDAQMTRMAAAKPTPAPCAHCGDTPRVYMTDHYEIVCSCYDGADDSTTRHRFASGTVLASAVAGWNALQDEERRG